MTHFYHQRKIISYNIGSFYVQGVIPIENKLQELRELHELKQQDVANALGVSRSTYASYEAGRRTPDIDTLMRLADVYGMTLDELTGHKVNRANGLELTSQAMHLLKSFYKLSADMQKWYISHMAVDAESKPYSAEALSPIKRVCAEKFDAQK